MCSRSLVFLREPYNIHPSFAYQCMHKIAGIYDRVPERYGLLLKVLGPTYMNLQPSKLPDGCILPPQ